MSRVDVIVPCYKYGWCLRPCVESILNQSHSDLRVLIIDDASPDNTEEVARDLAARDSRVAYRRNAMNRGHIAAYNDGLNWATGAYIHLLSADDLLSPGALERAARFLECEPRIGFVYGRHLDFQGQPPQVQVDPHEPRRTIEDHDEFVARACALGSTTIESPTVVVRGALQRRLGGYLADLPHSGDTEMWLRFAAHAPVGFIDAVQALKRNHAANMNMHYGAAWRLRQQKSAFDIHFARYGRLLGQLLEQRRADVCKSLGEKAFWGAYNAFERGDSRTCDEYLDFVEATYPQIRRWPAWRRLRLKRVIGPWLWTRLRPLMESVSNKKMQPGCS